MAEFLLYAKNNFNSDSIKESRGCYKRGDIVVVMPDGHEWGADEGLPNFVVLKIPGLDHVKAQKLMNSQIVDTGLLDQSGAPILKTLRRRAFSVDVATLPKAVKDALQTGVVSVSWSQVRSYIQDRVEGGSMDAVAEEVFK